MICDLLFCQTMTGNCQRAAYVADVGGKNRRNCRLFVVVVFLWFLPGGKN